MLQIQAIVLKQMKMFSKRYSSKRKRKHFVLKYSDWFIRLSCFQNVPKHSDLSCTHFKNVLGNFQDCSEMFSFFGTLQKCSKILKYFQNCSETF